MTSVDQAKCVSNVKSFDRKLSNVDDSVTVHLNINSKTNSNGDDVRIGSFLGNKGAKIKTLSGKCKSRYLKEFPDDTLGGFLLQVNNVDDNIVATWKNVEGVSNVDRFNQLVLEEISICEGITNGTLKPVRNSKKVTKPKNKKQVNKVFYSFWVPINSRFIGKVIGVEGSVICQLIDDLREELNLDRSPSIRINDTGRKLSEQYHLKMDNPEFKNESDRDTGIWITVIYQGSKAFKIVQTKCQSFIDSNFSVNNDNCADDYVDDSEEDDPEDSGNGWD